MLLNKSDDIRKPLIKNSIEAKENRTGVRLVQLRFKSKLHDATCLKNRSCTQEEDPSATATRMVVPPSSTAAKRMVPNAASRNAGLEESATITSTDAGHWNYTLFGATL